jgi:hypothetical protein
MARKTSATRREAFFRALRETGNQTIAAERAKVSRSWVRLHREHDADFKARLDAALKAARERLDGVGDASPVRGWGSLDGEELVVRGCAGRRVQIARARLNQWTPRAEARFLEALAATCNVTAACAQVGLSASAAYYHANRWPDFAARWRAAVEEGYFRIEMQLMERAGRAFSPAVSADSADEQADAAVAGAVAELTDEEAFKRMSKHRYIVRGLGKAQGRQATSTNALREEAVTVLTRAIERIEARKAKGAMADAARQAADRAAWDARGAR